MADQDISFRLSLENKEAVEGFQEVQNKIDGLKDSAKETAPVIDEVSEVLEDAGDSASFATEMSSMLAGMLGGAVVAGTQLATRAVGLLIDSYLKSDSAIEGLIPKLKDLWAETYKNTVEWGNFRRELEKFTEIELEQSLIGLANRLSEITGKLHGYFSMWTQFTEAVGITDFKGEAEKIGQEVKVINDVLTMKDLQKRGLGGLFDNAYLNPKNFEPIKEQTKALKEESFDLLNVIEKLEAEYVKWLRDVEKNERTRLPYADRGKTNITGGRGKVTGGKENASMTQQFAEDMDFMNGLIMSSANILRNEFMQAWEDIFGEANSLFEKFIANIVAAFADLAAQKMAMGIFGFFANLFTGGAASAITAIASSPSSGQTINLQMDNQTMATWYVGGKNQASRLRMD